MKKNSSTDSRSASYLQQRRFAREYVLQFLYQNDSDQDWERSPDEESDFQNLLETEKDLEDRTIFPKPKTREFISSLTKGILQEREKLDQTIEAAASNWSLGRMSMVDRNILRLAAYEICYCPEIPEITSINEAVELSKKFGDKNSAGFINGILDRIRKQ